MWSWGHCLSSTFPRSTSVLRCPIKQARGNNSFFGALTENNNLLCTRPFTLSHFRLGKCSWCVWLWGFVCLVGVLTFLETLGAVLFFSVYSVSRTRTFHRSVNNSQVPLPDRHHPHLCFSQGFLASLHLDNYFFFLATVDVKIFCLVQLHLINTWCSHFLF